MGALGQLYGLKINYYVAVDLDSFRDVVNTLGGVDRGRPDPGLRRGLPVGRRTRQPQALRAAGHAVDERPACARVCALTPRLVRLRPRGAPAARHHLGARPDRPLVAPRSPASSTSSSSRSRKSVKTNIPPKLDAQAASRWRRRSTSTAARTSCSPSSAGYARVCYPCPPNGLLDAHRQPGQHPSAPSRTSSRATQGREGAEAASRTREPSSTSSTAPAARNTKATNIADALRRAGWTRWSRRSTRAGPTTNDYKDTVITVYNGAAERPAADVQAAQAAPSRDGARSSKPTTPSQIADVVVIVGSKTKPLKPPR